MVKKIAEKKMMCDFLGTFTSAFLILLLTCFITVQGGIIGLLLKHDRLIVEIKSAIKRVHDLVIINQRTR